MRASLLHPTLFNRFLSGFYRAGVSLRNRLYNRGWLKAETCGLPVLSVGNVTVGGSGKSPFASFLAMGLLARGYHPVILSRGYGGRTRGPHLVDARDSARDVGDEPLMHFRNFGGDVPVVVARRRAAGARFIASRKIGDVIVLDDGFQHRRLRRDLDIVLVDLSAPDAAEAFRRNLLLPAGPLRENAAAAFQRAGCVIWVERKFAMNDEVLPAAEELPFTVPCPVFRCFFSPRDLVDIHSERRAPITEVIGRKVSVVTAIAYPERFVMMVRDLGVEIVENRAFDDHHPITVKEWEAIRMKSPKPILMTAKDAAKIAPLVKSPGCAFSLELQCAFSEKADDDAFWSLVLSRISTRKAEVGQG